MTNSLEYAISETNRRRSAQNAYNEKHGITPASVKKGISDILQSVYEMDYNTVDTGVSGDIELVGNNYQTHIKNLDGRMKQAAGNLEFEEAARIRDEIRRLEAVELGLGKPGMSKLAAAQAGLGKTRMPSKKIQSHSSAKASNSKKKRRRS
jgi:excinuclease ABC subunit B